MCHVAFNGEVYSTTNFDEIIRICSARRSYWNYNPMAETWRPLRAVSTANGQILVCQTELPTGKRYWYKLYQRFNVPFPFFQHESYTTNSSITFNSTLVAVKKLLHCEKVNIGRIERPNQRYLISQVNGTSGKITFAEEGVQVEESGKKLTF